MQNNSIEETIMYEYPDTIGISYKNLSIKLYGSGDSDCFIRKIEKNKMDKDTFCKRLQMSKYGIINSIKSGKYDGYMSHTEPYFRNKVYPNQTNFQDLLYIIYIRIKTDSYKLYDIIDFLNDYNEPIYINFFENYNSVWEKNPYIKTNSELYEKYVIDSIYAEVFNSIFGVISINELCNFEHVYSDGNEEILYFENEQYRFGITMFTS